MWRGLGSWRRCSSSRSWLCRRRPKKKAARGKEEEGWGLCVFRSRPRRRRPRGCCEGEGAGAGKVARRVVRYGGIGTGAGFLVVGGGVAGTCMAT